MAKGNHLKSVFTVGALTSLSRVLGLVREMFQSRLIGAGVEQSAFTLAFALPNMARKVFGEGALTAAFVPIFRCELETKGLEQARQLARAVLTMAFLMMGAIVLLAVGGLTTALHFVSSDRSLLIVRLTRILMPYMLFICAAAFGMGVLNAMGRFAAAAFMPCLLNVIWIGSLAALLFFGDLSLEARIVSVCYAILGAGFLQMLFIFVCMKRRGVSPRLVFRGWTEPSVQLVWKNTFIAAVGAGAVQVNYLLDQVLGQIASPWAASVIGYAERLMDLPLGIIGVSFGTVLLPTLGGFFAREDVAGAGRAFASLLRSLFIVMIPSAVGLSFLAPEVTRVIYEGHAFDAVATVRVSRALAVYSVGLVFFGCQKLLVPWFQAQRDMKTPLRVSVLTVVINAILNILAVWLLPVEYRTVGLAVSTVVCSAVGCGVLIYLACPTGLIPHLKATGKTLFRALIAAAVMGVVLQLLKEPLQVAASRFGTVLGGIVSLGGLVLSGIIVYGVGAFILMKEDLKVLRRRK